MVGSFRLFVGLGEFILNSRKKNKQIIQILVFFFFLHANVAKRGEKYRVCDFDGIECLKTIKGKQFHLK